MRHECGGQRTPRMNQFSPSNTWISNSIYQAWWQHLYSLSHLSWLAHESFNVQE